MSLKIPKIKRTQMTWDYKGRDPSRDPPPPKSVVYRNALKLMKKRPDIFRKVVEEAKKTGNAPYH